MSHMFSNYLTTVPFHMGRVDTICPVCCKAGEVKLVKITKLDEHAFKRDEFARANEARYYRVEYQMCDVCYRASIARMEVAHG